MMMMMTFFGHRQSKDFTLILW